MGDLQARPVNQPQRGENLAGRGNRRAQDSCQGIRNSRSRHPQDEKPRKRAVFRGRATIRPGGKTPPLPAPPPSKKTATDSPGAICSTEPSKPPMAAPVLEDSVGRNPADRPASCLTRFSGKEPCPSAMARNPRTLPREGPAVYQPGAPARNRATLRSRSIGPSVQRTRSSCLNQSVLAAKQYPSPLGWVATILAGNRSVMPTSCPGVF